MTPPIELLHCAAPTAVLDYNTSPFSWERPLSLQPLSPYAVAHNEMEHYTASLRISAACKNMIEDAIAAAYQDRRFQLCYVQRCLWSARRKWRWQNNADAHDLHGAESDERRNSI